MNNIDTFGRIYYPDSSKDEILGVRLFAENDKIYIEFEFQLLKQPDRVEIMIGTFNKLGKVTCLYNTYYGGNYGSGGNLCRYRVGYMLTGEHYVKIEDIRFDKAIIEASSLFEWFNIKTLKFIKEPQTAIQYGSIEEVQINTNLFKDSKFTFGYQSSFSRDSYKINEYIAIRLESDEPQKYTDFIDFLIRLKKFFSFISTDILNPQIITFYNNKLLNENGGVKVEYYDLRKELEPCPTSDFLNIRYIDIENSFPDIVGKWIELSKSNPVIDFLLEKAYNNELSYKTYFLNTCFAIEIFHKSYVNNQKLSDDEMKYIKSHLFEKIKDPKVCDWIKSKLNMGNHPSFKDRLVHFIDIFSIINSDPTLLVNQIVNTRNHLIHSGAKKRFVVNDELSLLSIAMTLETVIKGAVLNLLGVDTEDTKKMYLSAKGHLERFINLNTQF